MLEFHEVNGGLSRYVKFRHFFEVRGESLSDDRLAELVESFSDYMRRRLTNPDFLIQPTIACLEAYSQRLPMYIVSGADQAELRYLNEQLMLAHHFRGIYGSPTPKIELVRRIVADNGYTPDECVLIGDSINDYEAADKNNIEFVGYNNPEIEQRSTIELTDVFPASPDE